MAGIACTHVAMGWIGGVLYSRVAWTHSCFRGSESRLIYVGRDLHMSCGLESPAGFLIGSNHHCSSVMETQLTVHHRSINNWNLRKVCEKD